MGAGVDTVGGGGIIHSEIRVGYGESGGEPMVNSMVDTGGSGQKGK